MDSSLNKFYSQGTEKNRLTTHQLERDRTLHILSRFLPSPPATIYDIGGAAGVYAVPLTQLGYQVHLLDPVALHIEQAKAHNLASCTQGDARHLPYEDESADVVLLLGPLYHLTTSADRHKALIEAHRVLKPNGILFAAGISRFASYMDYMNKKVVYSKFATIEQDFATGLHRKTTDEEFTFGYFHKPDDLKCELQDAAFKDITLRAIEGPVWADEIIQTLYKTPESWQHLINLLDQIESEETLLGASAHMMAIAKK